MRTVLTKLEQSGILKFKQLVSPEQYASKDIWISYVGPKLDSGKQVHSARVFIRNYNSSWNEFDVETEHLFAGRCNLSKVGKSLNDVIDRCSEGYLALPFGDITFPGRSADTTFPSVYFDPAHASVTQQRVTVLRFGGGPIENPRFDKTIEWELRAAEKPFNSYRELANELSLGGAYESNPTVEFVAYQSAAIDRARTRVEGGALTIVVVLAKGLDPANFSLGVRRESQGQTTRYSIQAGEFDWNERDELIEGFLTTVVDRSELFQFFANYNGVNYADYWVADPSSSNNPRRIALALFDPNLNQTKNWLLPDDGTKRKSRDFELGVSRLFWALGFSPALVDNPYGKSDIPDLVVTDANGRFLLLECTVGRIGANDKLEKLAEREQSVKDQLILHNLGHIETASAIVTRMKLETISTDLQRASELNISVLGPDDVERLLNEAVSDIDSAVVMNWIVSKKPGLANEEASA